MAKLIWYGRRFVVALAAILLIVLVAGTAYQYTQNLRDLRDHPAPGQLVDVGGHRLHLWCVGTGSPVVVLEAGGAGNALEWSLVQPAVARETRVCSYDRAGFGWSDLGPNPRTASQIVTELHSLLQNARVPGPIVLTGHSIGGLYVRLYASRYPSDVAGMVLVDATHEDQRQRMPPEAGAAVNPFVLRLVSDLHSLMTVVGYARAVGIRFVIPGRVLSPEARLLAEGIKVRTTVPFADGSESQSAEESAAEVRRTRAVLNIPLVVVSRGRFDAIRRLPQEQQQRIKKAWNDMQADLVKVSVDGTQVVAERSDHYVHVEQPDKVIEAIRDVVREVQSIARSST